ncbi:hypothetical protein LZC95_46955 [Pendulispora brunnea]|uniref:Uncharacterized protein n=1 Tax=Pendulispora brunnea TaxID=2905690 RepID=A0ABZ2K7A9_9BACT
MTKMSPEARWLNEQYVAKINAAVADAESTRVDELADLYEEERWRSRTLVEVWTQLIQLRLRRRAS